MSDHVPPSMEVQIQERIAHARSCLCTGCRVVLVVHEAITDKSASAGELAALSLTLTNGADALLRESARRIVREVDG